MERESFEDEEIARYLNEHFVAVKVDREERPDVDDVYMKAVQLLSRTRRVAHHPGVDTLTDASPSLGEPTSRHATAIAVPAEGLPLTILRELCTSATPRARRRWSPRPRS
jgi:hypothetical protein